MAKIEKKVLNVSPLYGEFQIIVLYTRTFFWFFKKQWLRIYRGDLTVFHEYPTGIRQSTHTETWLSNIVKNYKYKMEK